MVKPQWSRYKVTLYHDQPTTTRLDHGLFDPTNLIRHAWKKTRPDPNWECIERARPKFSTCHKFWTGPKFSPETRKTQHENYTWKIRFYQTQHDHVSGWASTEILARWSDRVSTGRRKKPTGFFLTQPEPDRTRPIIRSSQDNTNPSQPTVWSTLTIPTKSPYINVSAHATLECKHVFSNSFYITLRSYTLPLFLF
jgi:hypothetical protein